MSFPSKSGTLANAVSGTGRSSVKLPAITSVVTLFITATSTFSLNVEVSNVVNVYVPIVTITGSAAVQIAMPVNAVAVNITANAGTVTVTYQMIVRDALPSEALQVFQAGALLAPYTLPTTITANIDYRKRLYGPAQPTNGAAATIYTVPALKKTTINAIILNNTTAADATITLSLGVSAAVTQLMTTFNVPANKFIVVPYEMSMVAAEVIQATQGTLNAITLIINGEELTA